MADEIFEATVANATALHVTQRKELAELFGFETRNKYSIEDENDLPLGFAAEQQKGVLGFLLRQFLGHWRTYELHVFGKLREPVLRAIHPFRWIFPRLEVVRGDGGSIGAIQGRWSVLSKRFDVEGPNGETLFQVSSPIFSPWTFGFVRDGRERAFVRKRWSGLLKEAFTDADRFRVEYADPSLSRDEKLLVLAAALFVDLRYFEKKAN